MMEVKMLALTEYNTGL